MGVKRKYLKSISKVLPGSFKGVTIKFLGRFMEAFMHMCFKKILMFFQECFQEVLFCNFVFEWKSLQLIEQK